MNTQQTNSWLNMVQVEVNNNQNVFFFCKISEWNIWRLKSHEAEPLYDFPSKKPTTAISSILNLLYHITYYNYNLSTNNIYTENFSIQFSKDFIDFSTIRRTL